VYVVSGRIKENDKNAKKQWFSKFPESQQITENVKKHKFCQKPEIQKNPENEEKHRPGILLFQSVLTTNTSIIHQGMIPNSEFF